MKIIDAHIHFSHIGSFHRTAHDLSLVDYSFKGFEKEFGDAGVVFSIAMGLREIEGGEGFPDRTPSTPMGVDLSSSIPGRMAVCQGVNPYRLGKKDLDRLEKELLRPETAGIKIYLGYYPFYAHDRVYGPVYELAAAYRLPVVLHTGDTYSERGLLKYAHPLTIDETAVYNRDVTFIMAHFGDPWMLDAAEVVYKNPNVFADLSGLIVGDEREVKRISGTPHFFDHFNHALAFCDHYEKLLFGTDWPLVEVRPYADFIASKIPAKYHDDVFYNTALRVFPKIRPLIPD
ncbi:amidohydrolase family protein [Alteribacter natronophilus]|uniref:amidohydrolase family protein n=1 Tax=Alteribacter natronophilus TaxID=2583810 RepID=UPI00110E1E04|nr:amidohydrolase family protein [Alteribacter natronophilus]TMW73347.1 amidohydrolase [Alteribacter natronophilus]